MRLFGFFGPRLFGELAFDGFDLSGALVEFVNPFGEEDPVFFGIAGVLA
jgi:hypothetical protein